MRAIRTVLAGVPVNIERFDGTGDLLRRISVPVRPNALSGFDYLNGDPPSDRGFQGFSSGDELVRRLKEGIAEDPGEIGWDSPVRTCEVERLADYRADVAGGMVIVPNLMAGEPRCMLSVRRKKVSSRILRLCIDVTLTHIYNPDQYRMAGLAVMRAIDALERAGYTVLLTIAYTTYARTDRGQREIFAMTVPFKGPGEPLNIRRCMYPLSDISYMRGVGFCWSVHKDGFSDLSMGFDVEQAWDGIARTINTEAFYRRILGPDWLMVRSVDLVNHGLRGGDVAGWIVARLLKTSA